MFPSIPPLPPFRTGTAQPALSGVPAGTDRWESMSEASSIVTFVQECVDLGKTGHLQLPAPALQQPLQPQVIGAAAAAEPSSPAPAVVKWANAEPATGQLQAGQYVHMGVSDPKFPTCALIVAQGRVVADTVNTQKTLHNCPCIKTAPGDCTDVNSIFFPSGHLVSFSARRAEGPGRQAGCAQAPRGRHLPVAERAQAPGGPEEHLRSDQRALHRCKE
jgi:hypothetical protein